MNIYIDESGSINNRNSTYNPYFVIALIRVKNDKKLRTAFKRFVSSNFERLKELDRDRVNSVGEIVRPGGKMFTPDGKFKELKGSQFDADMRKRFVSFFSQKPYFEVFYIKIDNAKISDRFCENTARAFNYSLKLAISYFLANGFLPQEDYVMQLDERNEKTETKFFLENYLNTELNTSGATNSKFQVIYFDSVNNHFIQIADVFANLLYSNTLHGQYEEELQSLQQNGFIKFIFNFPPVSSC